ncbi:MAG: hypothetical protein K2Y30_14985 [Flavobacteriaceae bacterium]|nr:hypothetical protein [Flavobacteriaceae bacterium]
MKNLPVLCLLLAGLGFTSCKNDSTKKAEDTAKTSIETPVSTDCYKAIYEQDTLDLKINTLKAGTVTGDLEMKIENMPTKLGQIVGEFRGDTLFASYTFIQGTNEKKTFKNPMAFLKNGNELILGNGKIEFALGASYFAKGEPIDFENVKYKFTAVECLEK